MTALPKPDGGVRGIVAGDVIRKLVARTMTQQRPLHTPLRVQPFWLEVFSVTCVLLLLVTWVDQDHHAIPHRSSGTSPEASRRQWKGRKVCEGALAERAPNAHFPNKVHTQGGWEVVKTPTPMRPPEY